MTALRTASATQSRSSCRCDDLNIADCGDSSIASMSFPRSPDWSGFGISAKAKLFRGRIALPSSAGVVRRVDRLMGQPDSTLNASMFSANTDASCGRRTTGRAGRCARSSTISLGGTCTGRRTNRSIRMRPTQVRRHFRSTIPKGGAGIQPISTISIEGAGTVRHCVTSVIARLFSAFGVRRVCRSATRATRGQACPTFDDDT